MSNSNDDDVQYGPISEATVSTLEEGFIQTALTFVLWGLVLGLSILSFYALASKGIRQSRSRAFLLGMIFVLFASSTVRSILYVHFWVVQLQTLGPNPRDIYNFLTRVNMANAWLARLIYFLNDCIVVWRAWVLWPESRAIRCTLAICLVVTWAAGLADIIITTLTHLAVLPIDLAWNLNLQLLMFIPLLMTNVISTSLIGVKAWRYRQQVKSFIANDGNGISPTVLRILMLLVESGFVYCVFWLFYILADYEVFPDSLSSTSWEIVVTYIAVMYPMVIVLVVSCQRSSEDAIKSDANTLAGSMQFAPNPPSKATESTMTVSDIHFRSRTSVDVRGSVPGRNQEVSVMA